MLTLTALLALSNTYNAHAYIISNLRFKAGGKTCTQNLHKKLDVWKQTGKRTHKANSTIDRERRAPARTGSERFTWEWVALSSHNAGFSARVWRFNTYLLSYSHGFGQDWCWIGGLMGLGISFRVSVLDFRVFKFGFGLRVSMWDKHKPSH